MLSLHRAFERGGVIADADTDTDPIRVSWLLRMGDRFDEPTEIMVQHIDRQSGRGRRIWKQYVLIARRINARCAGRAD